MNVKAIEVNTSNAARIEELNEQRNAMFACCSGLNAAQTVRGVGWNSPVIVAARRMSMAGGNR